jgi:hypothetical protein
MQPSKIGAGDSTLLKLNGIYWVASLELDRRASRLAGAFGWLQGLDLNQRPLGYEFIRSEVSG